MTAHFLKQKKCSKKPFGTPLFMIPYSEIRFHFIYHTPIQAKKQVEK